jgi:hypothetical protein
VTLNAETGANRGADAVQARSRAPVVLSLIAVMTVATVVLVVNVLIYRARYLFIQWHPDYVAKQQPTISRAIADPLIGEPFAFWMAVCAPLLFIGVGCIVALARRDVRTHAADDAPLMRRFDRMFALLLLLQVMACVGMVMLSHYRFPDFGAMHMTGSYIFFFSQGFVVVAGGVLAGLLMRLPGSDERMILPGMNRLRRRLTMVPILMAISYLALFVLKDVPVFQGNKALYQAYVWMEPAVLSSFLIYVGLFLVDLVIGIWRHWSR